MWTSLALLAAALTLLLFAERWIHRRLQGVALLLTGDPEIAVPLYTLPLLPGIVLHELSHAIAAILLGAHVGRISIRPQRAGERIRLGFVPIERTGAVRASLIGLAPLLVGSGVILLIGYGVFGIGTVSAALFTGDWLTLLAGLVEVLKASDAWLWAYVIFAVSNTMLPSQTDRQSWRPVIIFLLLAGGLMWLAGLGPAIATSLATPLTTALRWLTAAIALTLAADLPFMLAIALGEKGLERVRGVKVVY